MKNHATKTGKGRLLSRRAALALAAQGSLSLALSGCGKTQESQSGTGASNSGTPAANGSSDTGRPSFLAQAAIVVAEKIAANASSPAVDAGLSNVDVPEEFYFKDEQLARLESLGFFVDSNSYGQEFYPIYEENRYANLANYVTVDSLMHTYHLYFQYLLKNLERTVLYDKLVSMTQKLLAECIRQQDELAGTAWEDASRRCALFIGVASALLDPSASLPDALASDVEAEISQIEAAAGVAESIVTGMKLDYTQFIVRGYYEGDETLERYFRAMMWYGQVGFYQRSEELDRCAALLTLALNGDAFDDWKAIYVVTSFFAGASDDCGYYEYLPLLKEAYGEDVTTGSLADEEAWQAFHALTADLPAPQINSLPDSDATDLDEKKNFRLMGQRFSIDSAIFQRLFGKYLDANEKGDMRSLPDALDIPAAFGSDEALKILDETGATSYGGYTEHMDKLRKRVAAAEDSFWQASLYNQWLYALLPMLEEKGEGYPSFMTSSAWARRTLEGFLGSYTELKHDTVLYSKQALAEGDGDYIREHDDRGYVEAEPLFFLRLRNLCAATAEGLEQFGMIGQTQLDDLDILAQLSEKLSAIAKKELTGELPTDDEFELIRSIGVQLEHFWEQVFTEEAEKRGIPLDTRQFPAGVVVDVATGGMACLELGTGYVRKMYVIVPVDGKLRVASGPVFSFYQFSQPTSERMTDTSWRDLYQHNYDNSDKRVVSPAWTDSYRVDRTW